MGLLIYSATKLTVIKIQLFYLNKLFPWLLQDWLIYKILKKLILTVFASVMVALREW